MLGVCPFLLGEGSIPYVNVSINVYIYMYMILCMKNDI